MLKLLVKKQLTEIFRAYLYDAKKNRARSKAATVGYIIFFVLLMVGVIGGMFTTLSLTMCRSMAEAGMSWFYFAIMGLMAILLGAFGSVFTTYSSLYLPKDNDQMLSLPIPVNTLIAARLLGVYLMGLMYSGVVVLPAIIVYWVTVSAAPLHLLAGVLFLLLISLFVMAISCLLGWVVAKVSLKLKNKSFVTVVLSLVFFGLYYYFFSFKATSLLTELLQNIALYGDKVRSSAYPVYLFGQAGAGDPLSMLLLTVAIAVLFGLTWLLLSRSFLSIATASGHVGRKVYRAKAVRCRSISSALLDRELHLCRPVIPPYMKKRRRMPVAYGVSSSCELLSHLQPHLVGLRVVIGVGVQVEADDLKPALPIKGNGPLVAGLCLQHRHPHGGRLLQHLLHQGGGHAAAPVLLLKNAQIADAPSVVPRLRRALRNAQQLPILKSAVHHRSLQPLPEQGVVEGPLLHLSEGMVLHPESLLHRDDIPAASGLIPCREAIPPPLDGIQLLDLHIAPPYRAVPFLGTYRRLMSTPSSLSSCTLRSSPPA